MGIERNKVIEASELSAPARFFGKALIELAEPNMYLLDMAEYSIDDGEWQPMEELLRIDNIARKECGIPLRRREVAQPYLLPEETACHNISLRFIIDSEIDLDTCMLGLEDRAHTQIQWNGKQIIAQSSGWYVDHAIETIPLPGIRKGRNLLQVSVPLGKRTNLEYMYLLGSFGVKVCGTSKCIIQFPVQIGLSDITHQGLPFYTGNLSYKFHINTKEHAFVRVPAYRGALVHALVDGKSIGRIVFSPYVLELAGVEPGEHELELVLYGTRQNGFGQLHHTPGIWFYQSPNSWRSTDQLWRYEYHLKEAGILQSPELYNAIFTEGKKKG